MPMTGQYLDGACLYIDGEFVEARSGETETVIEKATGSTLGTVGVASVPDVQSACAAARAAQAAWANAPWEERARVLRAVADAIDKRADEIQDLIVRETGAILGKAQYETSFSASALRDAAVAASRAVGEIVPSAVPGKLNIVERIPVGVVAVITPWNFPLVLSSYTIGPALALGNTVVLKPSPLTPLSGGTLLAELFHEAGLPAGVLNVVTGAPVEIGRALVADANVDMVHFTGSTAVGREIAVAAAQSLKKVTLEMGGNNAFVVLDDADVDAAANVGSWSTFHYQGQSCISATRHIVMRGVATEYEEALARLARTINVGNPLEDGVGLGPMISAGQVERAQGLLDSSLAQGARLIEGGTWDGLFFRPTVLAGVTASMPAFTEELFAPIAPITVVESEDEALALVNETSYGLAAAVFTADPWRGMAFARRVRSGMVHVNDTTNLAEVNVPFGGFGASGLGSRTGGDANVEQFTERRWVSVLDTPASYPWLYSEAS